MKLFSYEIPDYRVFQDSFEVPYDTEEENQKFYDESYRKISLNRFYQEYSLGSVAGYGASASVIQIQRKSDNKLFAAKIVQKEDNDSNLNQPDLTVPKWLLKAAREITVLRSVKSQNIVKLIDAVETEKHIFIILEFIESVGICKDFLDFITENISLRENDARYFFAQIVMGLYTLHQSHFIHRDLKLANILLEQSGRIVLIDFGLSRGCRRTSLCHSFVGTPRYTAPEVYYNGAEGYDGYQADLWSLGVILYEMVTGNSLTFYDNKADFFHYISTKDIQIPASLSDSLRSLLQSLLSRDPSKRPSIAEVLHHPWCQQSIQPPFSFLTYPPLSSFLADPSHYDLFSLHTPAKSFENTHTYVHPNTLWLDGNDDSVSSSFANLSASQTVTSAKEYINMIRQQYSSYLANKKEEGNDPTGSEPSIKISKKDIPTIPNESNADPNSLESRQDQATTSLFSIRPPSYASMSDLASKDTNRVPAVDGNEKVQQGAQTTPAISFNVVPSYTPALPQSDSHTNEGPSSTSRPTNYFLSCKLSSSDEEIGFPIDFCPPSTDPYENEDWEDSGEEYWCEEEAAPAPGSSTGNEHNHTSPHHEDSVNVNCEFDSKHNHSFSLMSSEESVDINEYYYY